MKQTTDLMYYGLNGQPDTTASTYDCQQSPLRRICNPASVNSGFAIHTATNLLRRALLVLTLLAGWGISSQAQERVALNFNGNYDQGGNIPYSAYSSYDDSYVVEVEVYCSRAQNGYGIGGVGAYCQWGDVNPSCNLICLC